LTIPLETQHTYLGREERNVYRVLMGKPEGKRPLGRLRRRWEDGIRMDQSPPAEPHAGGRHTEDSVLVLEKLVGIQ
jgi:hypothetical protein